MEPILKERRKIHTIGGSRMVALPKWWTKNAKEVEIEVFPDKVIIKKKGGEEE